MAWVLSVMKVIAETPLMTVFDDLKQKFAVFLVEDLGDCIAIPGEELDLDWILLFLEEGYRFEGTRLDGHPVILVVTKKLEIS